MHNQRVCRMHGGKAGQNIAAAEIRAAEGEAVTVITRHLLNLEAEPVTNPFEELALLAGRYRDAEVEAARRVNELSSIRSTDATGTEQLRGEVQMWLAVAGRASKVFTDMSKMDLFAKALAFELAKAEFLSSRIVVPLLEAVVTALGHYPADPDVRRVMATELQAIEGNAA
jgi:hypothetical protein